MSDHARSPTALEPGPVDRLRSLKTRLRDLHLEHDRTALQFRQNQAFGDMLVGVGIRWLEETFDLPTPESRSAAARLRARWRESQEYRQLETKYATLEDEARATLHSVLQRPPSLSKVRQAVLVPTKVARLEAVIDESIERVERPPPKRTVKRVGRSLARKGSSGASRKKPSMWELLSAIGSIASVFAVVFLVVTEALSIPIIASLLLTAIVFGALAVVSRVRGRRPTGLTPKHVESDRRERDDAYAVLAFGDTTNWMPWQALPRRSDNEHFWRWWDKLPTLLNRLDPDDRAELAWILDQQSRGVRDRDRFGERCRRLRERAKEKARTRS